MPVTAPIREFAGANEEYTPGGTGSGGGHHQPWLGKLADEATLIHGRNMSATFW